MTLALFGFVFLMSFLSQLNWIFSILPHDYLYPDLGDSMLLRAFIRIHFYGIISIN